MLRSGVPLSAELPDHRELEILLAPSCGHARLNAVDARGTSTSDAIALASRAASRALLRGRLDASGRIVVELQDLFPEL